MKFHRTAKFLVVTLLAAGMSLAKDTPDQQREKIRKMASATLADLYKLQPASQAAVQKSAGYAVFDNMGTHLLLVSAGRGAGIAVNSKTKQEIFMKMISAGAGLGVGVKDYRVIFVFETEAGADDVHEFRLGCFRSSGCRRQGQGVGWGILRSRECNAGCVGVPDHQEWSRPSGDSAGHQVFPERRPQQEVVLYWIPGFTS